MYLNVILYILFTMREWSVVQPCRLFKQVITHITPCILQQQSWLHYFSIVFFQSELMHLNKIACMCLCDGISQTTSRSSSVGATGRRRRSLHRPTCIGRSPLSSSRRRIRSRILLKRSRLMCLSVAFQTACTVSR